VYAGPESQARELAAQEYGDVEQSPWLEPDKVEGRIAKALGEKPPEGHRA